MNLVSILSPRYPAPTVMHPELGQSGDPFGCHNVNASTADFCSDVNPFGVSQLSPEKVIGAGLETSRQVVNTTQTLRSTSKK